MKKDILKNIAITLLVLVILGAIGWTYLEKHLKEFNTCKENLEYLTTYETQTIDTANGSITIGFINRALLINKK